MATFVKRTVAGGALTPKKSAVAVLKVNPLRAALAALELPTEAKAANVNFFEFVTMIYGRQGVGKTTFAAGFPDAVLFSCERVSPAVEAFDFNAAAGGVKNWDVFLRGVELLEKSPGRFGTVVVDTVEAAYQMCLEYVCASRGLKHPSDVDDFGKTWNAIKSEFAGALDRIWKSGRGLVFTAHAKELEITSHSGEKFWRIQPDVAGQAMKYLKAKTDNIFFADFVRGADGKPQRILITEGDEVVEAKHAHNLPRYLPFPKTGGAALVARAFAGDTVGIDVGTFKTGKETSKQGARLIEKEQVGRAVARATGGRSFKK